MHGAQLGKLLDGNTERDAVHVAIAPFQANGPLKPGQHIGIVDLDRLLAGDVPTKIGIVDPFLTQPVPGGSWFYLVLYPNTVTSMRHAWSCPAFVSQPERQQSEEWLRNYAKQMNPYELDPKYSDNKPSGDDAAFKLLVDGLLNKEIYAHGTDLHGLYELDNAEDLKFHAERFLGITINWDEYEFTCSC